VKKKCPSRACVLCARGPASGRGRWSWPPFRPRPHRQGREKLHQAAHERRSAATRAKNQCPHRTHRGRLLLSAHSLPDVRTPPNVLERVIKISRHPRGTVSATSWNAVPNFRKGRGGLGSRCCPLPTTSSNVLSPRDYGLPRLLSLYMTRCQRLVGTRRVPRPRPRFFVY